jgi:amino acid adenylation domain-containing protein
VITERPECAAKYWMTRLSRGHDGSSFPRDYRRECNADERSEVTLAIPSISWSRLVYTCDREGLAPSSALIGLLQILLHRYTAAETVEIGADLGPVLSVRTNIVAGCSVRENLLNTVVSVQEAEEHACSWANLALWCREAGRSPFQTIFRVLFTMLAETREDVNAAEVKEQPKGSCDLQISLQSFPASPMLRADYNPGQHKRETVENILRQFNFMVECFDRFLDQRVDQISLCSEVEARLIVERVESGVRESLASDCLHRRFEAQVLKTPLGIAIVMPGEHRQELTYADLNARANRLAHYLMAAGVRGDTLVALYLERTPELIVAMLAILKAGGAYLPIDLSYPQDRIAFMLADAESPIVITDSRTSKRLPKTDATVICIDNHESKWADLSSDNPVAVVDSDNLAYCIFTSGSTGTPKGVLITHRNVSRLLYATDPWFHFDERDTWTFFHSCAFDFSVWEIWGSLIYGGKLVIVSFADSRSPEHFYDLLMNEGVTVLNQTPSAFRQLVGVDENRPGQSLETLRLVIFGGEALNLQSLAVWFDKYGDERPRLVNMYGITETTVHVTYRPLKRSDLYDTPGSVIGQPIPDLTVHVLDSDLQPVPVGIPGEIFVGGAGVARGYLKRDELTAKRFVSNPFRKHSSKLYRSGDLARRLPGGDLEYLGRLDHQVKIRGFRIELGEVQAALTRLPSVREAFVIARDVEGDKTLVAYIVPADGDAPAMDKLRRALQLALPSYMVPSYFVYLPQLPLTNNGKIDAGALPEPVKQR